MDLAIPFTGIIDIPVQVTGVDAHLSSHARFLTRKVLPLCTAATWVCGLSEHSWCFAVPPTYNRGRPEIRSGQQRRGA
jgi:hypothetical protein